MINRQAGESIRYNRRVMTPQTLLKTIFGYDTFRPLQREVIENVLARRDSLAIMPTGGGKSLCYQIPALMFNGLTVVVSPLIALMKDQVEQLRAYGIPALYLNSTLSPEAYADNMEHIRRGEVKLLYVAPETLLTPRIFNLLDTVQVDLLTIDEAHCISEWGHDFRPEYRQLVDVRRRYPKAVCLALTATATPRVRADITRSLGFSQSNEFIASFNRENLYIEVAPKTDPLRQTTRLLERFKDQSGIIYCFSRKQVDELAAALTQRGYSARPYHAGLEDAERRRNQEDFIRDNVQIMVATIAFGMGINKPNVRFVIHYDLPKSLEGLPPYVIFSDKTLVEMAAYYPQSRESLSKISGVGQVKLNQYGQAFLQVIGPYCKKHGLAEKSKETGEAITRGKHDSGRRYSIVGKAYNEGANIQELLDRFGVKTTTIVNYLTQYAAAGNSIRFDESLQALAVSPPEMQQDAFAAFDEVGTAFLKAVFDKLEGQVNYDELKILRLVYLSKQGLD